MASVVLGPLVQGVSGTLGGVVFHAGGRAGVLSKTACRVRSCTDGQRARRGLLARGMLAWAQVGADARKGWESFAQTHVYPNRLSVARKLTGLQCFLKYNMLRDPLGTYFDWRVGPPVGASTEGPGVVGWDFSHVGWGYFENAWSISPAITGCLFAMRHVCVRASSEGAAMSKSFRGGPGASGFVGYYVASGQTQTLTGVITAKFGHLDAGEWVMFRTYFVSPGQWPSRSVSFLAHVT